jgi:hypothetical protein
MVTAIPHRRFYSMSGSRCLLGNHNFLPQIWADERGCAEQLTFRTREAVETDETAFDYHLGRDLVK